MLHHISIPAENPLRVAQVLAELWGGNMIVFPSNPGSYMVFACDDHGTAIEVYPLGSEMLPSTGDAPVKFQSNPSPSLFTATHAAISVAISQAQVEKIGAREGWRVVRCNRGPFEVIELWLENRMLIEVLPPVLASDYLAFTRPENLKQFFLETPAA
jgi:hypothetical protein